MRKPGGNWLSGGWRGWSLFAERVSGNFDELKQLCSRARVISWPREEKINFQVGHNFVWFYNEMHLMVVYEWY